MATRSPRAFFEYFISATVFLILGIYFYGKIFEATYIGFQINAGSGSVTSVLVQSTSNRNLQVGDILLEIDSKKWEDLRKNIRQPPVPRLPPGETVNILIRRGDQELLIPWTLPGMNLPELKGRLSQIWFPYIFWALGTATLLLLRPKDTRWRLLVAFNYLTAIFLIAGLVSVNAVYSSAVVMRVAVWLCIPVYWHLHWVFPQPIGRIPAALGWSVYLAGAVLAIAEWFGLLPVTAYFLGFLLAVLSAPILLPIHALTHPEQRRDLGPLLVAVFTVALPLTGLAVAGLFQNLNPLWVFPLVTLPLIPGAYFYSVYRHQMGGLELRTNRSITLLLYGVILFTLSILVVSITNRFFQDPGEDLFAAIALILLTGLVTASGYPRFQSWVERHLLHMPLAPTRLLETYSTRITTSLELEELTHLLRDEVLPSFLIRQAALLRLKGGLHPQPVFSLGLEEGQLPGAADIPAILRRAGEYRQPTGKLLESTCCPWARLILTLSVEGQPVGLCLLGRRDPDDYYAPTEVPTLQALMDQAGLALINIEQARSLRALYQADIERQEAERSQLARDLHDDVLGQLAMLAMSVDERTASSEFDSAYHATTMHIREIIGGLRPAMLSYGLHSALEELADEIAPPVGTPPDIEVNLSEGGPRYPPDVELHLYRIVQQACQNALRHAHASRISIQGRQYPGYAELGVEDNGVGFQAGEHLDLGKLLANRHYGLAGMHERAALIGAHLRISSSPGKGTFVQVVWTSPKDD